MIGFSSYHIQVAFCALFFLFKAIGQDSINLPTSKQEKNLSFFDNYLGSRGVDFRCTKDSKIFLNGKKLNFWDEIVVNLTKIEQEGLMHEGTLTKARIFAKSTLEYRFVDKLKSEIARTNIKFFLFMTEGYKSNFEAEIVHGTVEQKWHPEAIRPMNVRFDSIKLINTILPDWISSKTDSDKIEKADGAMIRKHLYKGNVDQLEELLNNRKLIMLRLMPNGKVKLQNHRLDDINVEIMDSYIPEEAIIFVKFDFNLLYEDYINFLQTKRLLVSKNRKRDKPKSFVFIEISYGLEEKAKKWDLQFLK